MKLPIKIPTSKTPGSFFTGVKSMIDRRIGGINVLSNHQILKEKTKLDNMRNGKVRP